MQVEELEKDREEGMRGDWRGVLEFPTAGVEWDLWTVLSALCSRAPALYEVDHPVKEVRRRLHLPKTRTNLNVSRSELSRRRNTTKAAPIEQDKPDDRDERPLIPQ